jgi:hypothetical protein
MTECSLARRVMFGVERAFSPNYEMRPKAGRSRACLLYKTMAISTGNCKCLQSDGHKLNLNERKSDNDVMQMRGAEGCLANQGTGGRYCMIVRLDQGSWDAQPCLTESELQRLDLCKGKCFFCFLFFS